jgi:hypothetical protein
MVTKGGKVVVQLEEPGVDTKPNPMTVIGLPESDDSAASFGFGLPPPKESDLSHRGGDVPNIPEISLQSDDQSLDLTGLRKSLEKMALQGNDPETIEEMFAAMEEFGGTYLLHHPLQHRCLCLRTNVRPLCNRCQG